MFHLYKPPDPQIRSMISAILGTSTDETCHVDIFYCINTTCYRDLSKIKCTKPELLNLCLGLAVGIEIYTYKHSPILRLRNVMASNFDIIYNLLIGVAQVY